MGTSIIVYLLALLIVAYVSAMAVTYIRMRHPRIVVCPENRQAVVVSVDAGQAAVGRVLNSPDVTLKACTRWPERADCHQACTSQILSEPRATLVSERVQAWMAGKTCAKCRRPFDPWHAVGPQPGLLDPGTLQTMRWDAVPAADLPSRLETDLPVCKHCQLFDDFRREFPDQLVDRHRMH